MAQEAITTGLDKPELVLTHLHASSVHYVNLTALSALVLMKNNVVVH